MTLPITELKELNDRLTKLLADPHPGLFTWVKAVQSIIHKMAEITGV